MSLEIRKQLDNSLNIFKENSLLKSNKKEFNKTLALQETLNNKILQIVMALESNNNLLTEDLSAKETQLSKLDGLQMQQIEKLEDLEKKFNNEKKLTEGRIELLENEKNKFKTYNDIWVKHFNPIFSKWSDPIQISRSFTGRKVAPLIADLKTQTDLWMQLTIPQ